MNLSDEEKKGNHQFSTTKFAIFFAVGLLLRLLNIPSHNMDMIEYTKWYDYIAQHGIINAMGDEFSIYTPPYLYLLSLMTLTQPFLSTLTAIKLIPIFF